MYNKLLTTPLDIYPVSIPVLQSPPGQSIPLIQTHREFKGEKIETIISSYVSSIYLKLINWNNVYLVKFPSSIISVPSIIYNKSENNSGIWLNIDVSTAKMDVKTNQIGVTDYTAFASCMLYGINKILFNNMRDEQVLSDVYNSMCGFLYTLIIRSYIKEIDLNNVLDQDIANAYYLVAKLVGNKYIDVSGNINAIATVSTQKFFIKEDANKKRLVTARFSIDELPKDKEINDFNSLFNAFEELDIFTGITLSDFRTRLTKMFSPSLLSSLANGLDFVSMLTSCKLPSEVFSQRIFSIRPSSVIQISNILYKYIMDMSNNNIIKQDDTVLPAGW